jgi:hypothetical protein
MSLPLCSKRARNIGFSPAAGKSYFEEPKAQKTQSLYSELAFISVHSRFAYRLRLFFPRRGRPSLAFDALLGLGFNGCLYSPPQTLRTTSPRP